MIRVKSTYYEYLARIIKYKEEGGEKMDDPHKMKTIFSWKICDPSVGF
jgi:hypothetical protein